MVLSRRYMVLAGTGAALAPIALGTPALAQAADDAAITAQIEELRLGLEKQDKAKLEAVTSANLSYGHSAGVIETKEQFVTAVMNRKSVVKWLKFTEPKLAVHGNTAIARHFYEQESETDGKSAQIKIGVLQVWQKEAGGWKLYARQAHILPPKT